MFGSELKASGSDYDTMIPDSNITSFSGDMGMAFGPMSRGKLDSIYEEGEKSDIRGKAVNQIIDQLFDEDNDVDTSDDKAFNPFFGIQSQVKKPNNNYNPFSSPFGYMHKGLNPNNSQSNQNQNNNGVIGQHLATIKEVGVNHHKEGCVCEQCKMKELERIFSISSIMEKPVPKPMNQHQQFYPQQQYYQHPNQQMYLNYQNQYSSLRSYSSGDIAGNINQFMQEANYMY